VKHYEGMFILHNRELPEGEVADPLEVVRALVAKCGGEVAHSLLWANRKLAYPIEGNQTGTYVLTYFTGEPDTCSRLNREVAISDRCLRHLALAIDELPAADALPGPLSEPVIRPTRRPEEGEEGEGLAAVTGAALATAPALDPGPREEGEKEKKVHESLDYKNVYVLRRMVTSQGKLFSRVRSNLHAKHQRELRQAVLRARLLALLPFVAR
jgi:ribosomal protein S6/ribosomal protein S18